MGSDKFIGYLLICAAVMFLFCIRHSDAFRGKGVAVSVISYLLFVGIVYGIVMGIRCGIYLVTGW